MPENFANKNSNVIQVSDGVYINLKLITTEEQLFEKAIKKSFKELEKKELNKDSTTDKGKSDSSN